MKIVNDLLVFATGAISVVYLLNPTGGWVELIPDIVPVIGNLDEVLATTLLISCLAYFGLDITKILRRNGEDAKTDAKDDFIEVDSQKVGD